MVEKFSDTSYTKALEDKHLPAPSHRHAAPSAPWPWIDIHDELDRKQLESRMEPVPPLCDHKSCDNCWKGYPQSRFPNWTPSQQLRSKISNAKINYNKAVPCRLYYVDVNTEGFFTDAGEVVASNENIQETWDAMKFPTRLKDNRVRALFIEHLTGPMLQMLGTKFNIEPFFWSSSLNWIPSRFQEDPQAKKGDHITVTLTFLKSMDMESRDERASLMAPHRDNHSTLIDQMIDTRAPLMLRSNGRQLVIDLLSVHLIRNVEGSTIISYHPTMKNHPSTEAKYFHDRIRFAGQSVYWQKIFKTSPDPTFVFLTFIWHALYAWDEALQDLYRHICTLESEVIGTYDLRLTQELHIIRAHQLHYSSLLEDFRKTVEFVRDTKNPRMEAFEQHVREHSLGLLKRECSNLLSEIRRLELDRSMQEKRLKNVMALVFSSVNIDDSKQMQRMTEAAVKDSQAMKQIAYLTMVFLPASFVSGVFGMNISILVPGTGGSLVHYFAVAFSLTMTTVWVIVAFQSKYIYPDDTPLWVRFGWPIMLSLNVVKAMFGKNERQIPIRQAMQYNSTL